MDFTGNDGTRVADSVCADVFEALIASISRAAGSSVDGDRAVTALLSVAFSELKDYFRFRSFTHDTNSGDSKTQTQTPPPASSSAAASALNSGITAADSKSFL